MTIHLADTRIRMRHDGRAEDWKWAGGGVKAAAISGIFQTAWRDREVVPRFGGMCGLGTRPQLTA